MAKRPFRGRPAGSITNLNNGNGSSNKMTMAPRLFRCVLIALALVMWVFLLRDDGEVVQTMTPLKMGNKTTTQQPQPKANEVVSAKDKDAANGKDSKRLTTDPTIIAAAKKPTDPSIIAATKNPTTTTTIKKERSIAFVHVGKAGGNTVRAAFPGFWCQKNYGPKVVNGKTKEENVASLKACFQKHWRDDSPLSIAADLEIHLDIPDDLNEFTTFLFAVRNPVQRVLSSYLYLHHNNTNSPFAQERHPLKDKFYKECFPTLNLLLATIHSTGQREKTRLEPKAPADLDHYLQTSSKAQDPSHYCEQLAIAAVQGSSPLIRKINLHLAANYQFYHAGTIQKYPEKEVLAVRTESLWDDIKAMDQANGGTRPFPRAGEVVISNDYDHTQMESPTKEQLRDLCCLLWQEIEIYQQIVNRARNLDSTAKRKTMQAMLDTCNIVGLMNAFEDDRVKDSNDRARKENGEIFVYSWHGWHQIRCPPGFGGNLGGT